MKKSLTTVAMALAFTFSILAIGACAKSPSDEADGNGTAAEDSVGTGETPGSGENEGSGEQTGDGGSDNGAENGGDTGNEEETAPEPEDNYEYYITCKRDGVNIRSGAGTEHSVIGTAEKGTTYVLRGKVGDWYKTYYKNQTAYINASYFDVFSIEKSENDAVEEVLEKGYATLGVPYVYGRRASARRIRKFPQRFHDLEIRLFVSGTVRLLRRRAGGVADHYPTSIGTGNLRAPFRTQSGRQHLFHQCGQAELYGSGTNRACSDLSRR